MWKKSIRNRCCQKLSVKFFFNLKKIRNIDRFLFIDRIARVFGKTCLDFSCDIQVSPLSQLDHNKVPSDLAGFVLAAGPGQDTPAADASVAVRAPPRMIGGIVGAGSFETLRLAGISLLQPVQSARARGLEVFQGHIQSDARWL
jgi:hypothetical protein